MSLAALLTETVTVIRPNWDAVDEYGDPQPGTASTATYPARLEQLSSEEVVRDRDVVVADWRGYLPAGTIIGPFDRVESDGKTFEVWGDPIEHRSPRGVHHVQVKLRRVT